jgi:hypothetical protein
MSTLFDEYYPFDTGPGANSGESRWAVLGRFFRQSGVIPATEIADLSIANELGVYADGSGMNVKVRSGMIFIQGFTGKNSNTKTVTIATADPTNDRIDIVVARLDRSGDDGVIEIDILQGTPASSPVPVTLTQNSTVWEMLLAYVNVSAAVTSITSTKVENLHKTSSISGADFEKISSNTVAKSGGAYIVDGDLDITLPEYAAPGDYIAIAKGATGSWTVKSNGDAESQMIALGLNETGVSYQNSIELIRSNGQYAFVILRCVVGGNDQVWIIENGDSYLMVSANFFGDASDGDAVISSDTNLTSTQDGDMVVRQYRSLTINTGKTLSVSNRCKGLLIYVQGNLTISGTISMTAKGANVNPTTAGVSSSGIRWPMFKSGETDFLFAADYSGCGAAVIAAVANHQNIDANGKIYVIERAGNSGGTNEGGTGATGASGGNKTGGGGSGAGGGIRGGDGGAGTCFSGGSGGGAQYSDRSYESSCTGEANGGAGGDGYLYGVFDGGVYSAGAGAGNPGGTADNAAGQGEGYDGEDGTGGVVIILVGGDVTIESTGVIEADGKNGGYESYYGGGGGASGGGATILLYAGTLTNDGIVRANGGTGGQNGSHGSVGGNGGAGLVVLEQVD